MQKSIKSLKRNGILLLAYDLLVLCIVFVKNGMINMSAEAATSLIVSIGFGIFINLLWIVDSKTWITDYGKRKCIWSYWCGEIVLLLLVVALENMNQLVATSAILGIRSILVIRSGSSNSCIQSPSHKLAMDCGKMAVARSSFAHSMAPLGSSQTQKMSGFIFWA